MDLQGFIPRGRSPLRPTDKRQRKFRLAEHGGHIWYSILL